MVATETHPAPSPAEPATSGHAAPRVIALLRIVFGLVWAVDATLKWLPSFADATFLSTLRDARDGQPGPIRAWITVWLDVVDANPHLSAYALAVVETLIAVCLIAGAFTNVVCVGGALLSLLIWTTAEGFGGPYGAGSTDVAASIVYVIVFIAFLATAAGSLWGVDARVQPRLRRARWLCAKPVASRP